MPPAPTAVIHHRLGGGQSGDKPGQGGWVTTPARSVHTVGRVSRCTHRPMVMCLPSQLAHAGARGVAPFSPCLAASQHPCPPPPPHFAGGHPRPRVCQRRQPGAGRGAAQEPAERLARVRHLVPMERGEQQPLFFATWRWGWWAQGPGFVRLPGASPAAAPFVCSTPKSLKWALKWTITLFLAGYGLPHNEPGAPHTHTRTPLPRRLRCRAPALCGPPRLASWSSTCARCWRGSPLTSRALACSLALCRRPGEGSSALARQHGPRWCSAVMPDGTATLLGASLLDSC